MKKGSRQLFSSKNAVWQFVQNSFQIWIFFRVETNRTGDDAWTSSERVFSSQSFNPDFITSRGSQRRPQATTNADKDFCARTFRERASEAAAAHQPQRGSASRWSQLLLGRRSPTLPDLELNSMLQSYLDETSSGCQQQQQRDFLKFNDNPCQQNFSNSRNENKKSSFDNRGNHSEDEREELDDSSKMNFLPFECRHSTQNVGVDFGHHSHQHQHSFQSYGQEQVNLHHQQQQQQHLQQSETCHSKPYRHQQHTQDRSLLLLPNVSPISMDSGYGGPGSVGSLHSSSSAESPMHSGSNIGSFPSSPWAGQSQDYLNQGSPFIYSYETHLSANSSKCLPSPVVFQTPNGHQKTSHQHQIHPYIHPTQYCSTSSSSTGSLTGGNFYIPSGQTEQASQEFTNLEDEAQFEFGGCSQEEISNLVDQVLSSIDVFTTPNVTDTDTVVRLASGSLCQDCGNFVSVDSNPKPDATTDAVCQHCGASIRIEKSLDDENSDKNCLEDFDDSR